jgi:hypothetical protein
MTKKKGDQRKTTTLSPKQLVKQKVTAMKKRGGDVLTDVYGGSGDRDGPDGVAPSLRFDGVRLHELAEAVADEIDGLKDNITGIALTRQTESFERTVGRLDDRLRESRRIAEDLGRIRDLASKVGAGITLKTDPAVSEAFAKFESETGKEDQSAARAWLADVEARVRMVDSILTAINSAPGAVAIDRIPVALLQAAGSLQNLQRGIAREPRVATLQALFTDADNPFQVPDLIQSARAVGVSLSDVFNVCTRAYHAVDNLVSTLPPGATEDGGSRTPCSSRPVQVQAFHRSGRTRRGETSHRLC